MAIIASGDTTVGQRRNCHVSESARVELVDDFSSVFFKVEFINGSKGILNEPKVRANLNPVQVSRFSRTRLEVNLIFWFDKKVELLIRLSLIDFRVIPKPDVPIRPACDDFPAHESDVLDGPFVTWSVSVD